MQNAQECPSVPTRARKERWWRVGESNPCPFASDRPIRGHRPARQFPIQHLIHQRIGRSGNDRVCLTVAAVVLLTILAVLA